MSAAKHGCMRDISWVRSLCCRNNCTDNCRTYCACQLQQRIHGCVAVGVQLFRQLAQTIGHNRSHGKTLAEGKEQIEHNEEQRAQLARIKAVADDGYENGCIA